MNPWIPAAVVVSIFVIGWGISIWVEVSNFPEYEQYCFQRGWVYEGRHQCLDEGTGEYHQFNPATALRLYRP